MRLGFAMRDLLWLTIVVALAETGGKAWRARASLPNGNIIWP